MRRRPQESQRIECRHLKNHPKQIFTTFYNSLLDFFHDYGQLLARRHLRNNLHASILASLLFVKSCFIMFILLIFCFYVLNVSIRSLNLFFHFSMSLNKGPPQAQFLSIRIVAQKALIPSI